MDRDRVLQILRQHEPELKAAGLLHLRLFGSTARGEQTSRSDVDLLFDCDTSDTEKMLRAYGYQERVTELLGAEAHLSCTDNLKPAFRESILSEAVIAY